MTVRHVYVHVPFCARRCSYCDFSIAVRKRVPVDEYLGALRSELARAPGGRIATLYFGGGTPSLLGPGGVQRLLDLVRERYEPDADAEITLEANPEDVTFSAATAWRAAGVNRLSLGAQSFDDSVLAWMHRVHDTAAIPRAVSAARDAGFTNLSLDLIFALPESLNRNWDRDLRAAVALAPEHISLYGLTVEPATPLARWRDRGAVLEAPEERYEQEYLLAHRVLTGAGFEHYEVSNFGRPGFASRHNSAYWALVPYAGHGPSAHGFDGARRVWNEPVYMKWVERVRETGNALAGSEALTAEQRELERVYLSLRSSGGLEIAPDEEAVVRDWVAAGWAKPVDGRNGAWAALTASGWLRLDTLAASLTGTRSPCNV